MKRITLLSLAALAVAVTACSDTPMSPSASVRPNVDDAGNPPPPQIAGITRYGTIDEGGIGKLRIDAAEVAAAPGCEQSPFLACFASTYNQSRTVNSEILAITSDPVPDGLFRAIKFSPTQGSICGVAVDEAGNVQFDQSGQPIVTETCYPNGLGNVGRIIEYDDNDSKGTNIVVSSRPCPTFSTLGCQPGQTVVTTVDLRQFNRTGPSLICSAGTQLVSVTSTPAVGQTWFGVDQSSGGAGIRPQGTTSTGYTDGGVITPPLKFVPGPLVISPFNFVPNVAGASCHSHV